MARRRHTKRRTHRRRQQQRGGGWGFSGPAFTPAGGMAPEAARALTDDCAAPARVAPIVPQTGAWSQSGGGCGACAGAMPPQVGGEFSLNPLSWFSGSSKEAEKKEGPFGTGPTAGTDDLPELPMNGVSTVDSPSGAPNTPPAAAGAPDETIQVGGGGGGGGYSFVLDNTMGGKVYSDLRVGPCPTAPQRGGAAPTVSYPAGYGFGTASAIEEGGGSAHFLAPISYGKQCMGGGRRRVRRGRKSHRRGRKGRRHTRKH
jgi:hypothetical protein